MSEPPRYFVEQTPARQRNVALALARLTRPFSVFGPVLAEGDDFDALASRLAQDASEADPPLVLATEAVRHRLWQMPALAADDEPPTPAWFAYRSVVAHIYAADAVVSAPAEGLWNAYLAVQDLLDEAGQQAGDEHLAERLEDAVRAALTQEDDVRFNQLHDEVATVAEALVQRR